MSGALADILADASGGAAQPVAALRGDGLRGADVLALARRTADALAARGVRAGEPVHVTVANRPGDLGALLGVWLAGAVAVPVHATAAAATSNALRRATRARFSIDADGIAGIAADTPPARDLLRDAALIVFTSGSTGRPKGVVLGHAPFARKLEVLGRLLELRAGDVVVLPLPLTFIYGLWVALLALVTGARLVLLPHFSNDAIARTLEDGATVLAAVPSMLRTMLAGPIPDAPALRTILTGGEQLGAGLARAVGDAFPGAGVFNLYGLTETGSCDFCLTPADQPHGFGTIGVPTEEVAFRLAGEAGTGRAGELGIRTPFAMLGYLDDPALTAASFDDGYFRTGDLARRAAGGRVEIVGRLSEFISRGGNKIAPAEIENLLCAHPDVVAALCAGVPDARLGDAIHVMVVPRAGTAPDAEALRRWAAARIERYKVPDAIHLGEALPLGPTGKADRGALARVVAAAQGSEGLPPRAL